MRKVEVERQGHRIKIVVKPIGFLRNMVRAVVGTLTIIRKGKMSLNEFQSVIDSCDRSKAGKSAPACGLYLARVDYPIEVFTPKSLQSDSGKNS